MRDVAKAYMLLDSINADMKYFNSMANINLRSKHPNKFSGTEVEEGAYPSQIHEQIVGIRRKLLALDKAMTE